MRILVLSLRIINYNSANNALLNKASAPGVTLSEFVGKPSQPQTSQTWYDSALKNNNSIAQPWSTAELHRLGGPVHDEDPNAIGWMKTCDILLASEDADTFIAGVSVLAETCRRALVHLWRDLLSGPSSVPVEEQEESPQVENLFAKLDEMLGAHFENHWLRNLDEIDTPAKESHAYRYSMLMAYDRQLLRLVQKLKQDEFNLKIPPQYEMNRSLEDITKHAQENHDYRLQFDLLSRRVITSPISADGTVVGTIAALWRKTRNSWDCLKLLACVRRCLDTRSGEIRSLLDEINSYCGEAEKYLAGTPLLDLQQLLNYNNDHRTCDDLPDLMFFWQRTATAKNVSQLRTQHHLSLFDACIRGRTPVSSMPGGIVAPTGKTRIRIHACATLLTVTRSRCTNNGSRAEKRETPVVPRTHGHRKIIYDQCSHREQAAHFRSHGSLHFGDRNSFLQARRASDRVYRYAGLRRQKTFRCPGAPDGAKATQTGPPRRPTHSRRVLPHQHQYTEKRCCSRERYQRLPQAGR